MSSSLFTFTLISILSSSAFAQTFRLKDQHIGSGFYTGFNWETFDDPSGGFVNYLDQATAQSQNLSYGKTSTFV